MRIFFDTNVLLDVLIKREDEQLSESAVKAISAAKQLGAESFIATITIPTVAYVLKNKTGAEKKKTINAFLKSFSVIDSTAKHVQFALKSSFDDIEDAMQYACAEEHNCDLILTRDIKDFKNSRIPCMTPMEFLKEIS